MLVSKKLLSILKKYSDDSECYEICDLLSRKTNLKKDSGFFVFKGKARDHSWLKDSKGNIYDPTYSQFNKKIKVGIFPKGSPVHKKYYSFDLHHNPICLHKLLKISYPCEECGYKAKSNFILKENFMKRSDLYKITGCLFANGKKKLAKTIAGYQ